MYKTKTLRDNRRQIVGQVAHTQQPVAPVQISLAECIDSPSLIKIDFSAVLQLADELKSLGFLFGQTWPQDLVAPKVTIEAFAYLTELQDSQPIAYHFYTDGSKSKNKSVGTGVVLLIEIAQGWHYGGCFSRTVSLEQRSLYGEHGAIIWSLLWSIHLSDTHSHIYGRANIHFFFNFDAMVSGYTAAGLWRSHHGQ